MYITKRVQIDSPRRGTRLRLHSIVERLRTVRELGNKLPHGLPLRAVRERVRAIRLLRRTHPAVELEEFAEPQLRGEVLVDHELEHALHFWIEVDERGWRLGVFFRVDFFEGAPDGGCSHEADLRVI